MNDASAPGEAGASSEAAAPPFYTRYGFTRTGRAAAPLAIEPYPEICANGALRATVFASAIDLVGGFAARAVAGTDATFTTDLSLRVAAPGVPGRILAHAQPLRVGRRLVSTGVRLESAGATCAYGETTFTRIARAGPAPDASALATPDAIPFHPLTRPLDEEVGIETLDEPTASVRLALRPALLNPEGVLQGALVALLVECAALATAGRVHARPQIVSELDIRYLASASVGPVTGGAAWIGDASTRMLRVELLDRGRGDRRVASALVRVEDGPLE